VYPPYTPAGAVDGSIVLDPNDLASGSLTLHFEGAEGLGRFLSLTILNDVSRTHDIFGNSCGGLGRVCDTWTLGFIVPASDGGMGVEIEFLDDTGTALASDSFIVPGSLQGWSHAWMAIDDTLGANNRFLSVIIDSWSRVPEVGAPGLFALALAVVGAARTQRV
jgi:hypothetical protein